MNDETGPPGEISQGTRASVKRPRREEPKDSEAEDGAQQTFAPSPTGLSVAMIGRPKHHQDYCALVLHDIPHEVIELQVMRFLGGKNSLRTLGATCQEFRQLSKSDVVWKPICAKHGTKASKVYKKIMESLEDTTNTPKLAAFQARFRAFDQASQNPGAFENYKRLLRGYLRSVRDFNLECVECQNDNQETAERLFVVCAHPACPTALCLQHNGPIKKKCLQCRIQECRYHPTVSHPCSVVDECRICRKAFCLDCKPDSFHWFKCVGCTSTRIREVCGSCAWRVTTPKEMNAPRKAKPVGSVKAEDLDKTERVFCATCIRSWEQRGSRHMRDPRGGGEGRLLVEQ